MCIRDSTETWQRALALLREQAVSAFHVRDMTVRFMHPSWRVALLCAGTPFIAVGCVSVLAPVFFCYGLKGESHEPEVLLQEWPRDIVKGIGLITRTIEEVFGYEPLSLDDALSVVPGVELEHRPPHGTTLLAALISNDLNHYV